MLPPKKLGLFINKNIIIRFDPQKYGSFAKKKFKIFKIWLQLEEMR